MDKKNDKIVIQSVIRRDDVKISANVEEKYIFTTEDKIKLLYNEYNAATKYTGSILSQLGICLALWNSIITCDFKSIGAIGPEAVKTVFCVAAIASTIALGYTVVQRIRNRHKLTFEYFYNKIQGSEENHKVSLFQRMLERCKKKLFRIESDDSDGNRE